MHGAWGKVHLQCTQREQARQHFSSGGGEKTLLGQKTQSPGKASEIPGIHGKSQETSKNPGKFRDIFLVFMINETWFVLSEPLSRSSQQNLV